MRRRDIRYQAAVMRDDHVLLLHIIEHDGSTFWVPPGGGREAEETPEACVCREAFEETGLTVQVERFLFADRCSPGDCYDYTHTYLCRQHEGTVNREVEPEPHPAKNATIHGEGWFDLRDPGAWPPLVATDPITRSWLQKVRAVLGYS
jgi:8-oxo-dGTP pyrophosphatase MutT (NUDIX family)